MTGLRVDGARLVDAAGRPVMLRGVGLGGWMNMENFITGYPSTESVMRDALRKVMDQEAYDAFFDTFLDCFFTADDARFLAGLGLNSVRIPFGYKHFEDDSAPFVLKESGFARLDQAVEACRAAGLWAILDLHAAPGHQGQHWHADNPTHWASFWEHPHFQDRVVHLWEALAEHYRDHPAVAAYNPLNEPGDPTGRHIEPFYRRLVAAIRAVDPDRAIFLDGNRFGTDFSAFAQPLPNVVYAVHDYAVPGFADGGPYPGVSRGTHYDRAEIEAVLKRRTEFQRRTGTPLWVGEFGPLYTGDPVRDASRLRLLRDQLSLYQDHHAGWSLWTYKDIGLQGLVHARPDGPYVSLISPVLAKKERLGVDAWGGTDRHIRDEIGPLQTLFAREYPDFEPFPFGATRWFHNLVRHILLAEPMADDFAACFRDLTPQAARAAASSFALASCEVRAPLVDALKESG